MRRVRVTDVTVETQYYIFGVCVSSLRYPACKAHAPYCVVICCLPDATENFHIISHKRHDFRKKSLQLFSEAFLVLSTIQRDIMINVNLHVKVKISRYRPGQVLAVPGG